MSMKALLRYLERDGASDRISAVVQVVGNTSLSSFGEFGVGEELVGKLILSPEEFFSLDMPAYCACVMNQIEKVAGKDGRGAHFQWAGVVHTNTGDPHVHILIHGIDSYGHRTHIPREQVGNLHLIATEVQDAMTGAVPLTLDIITERRAAEKSRKMPSTSAGNLDSQIANRAYDQTWDEFLLGITEMRRKAAHARLIHLQNLGLLDVGSDRKIKLVPDLQVQSERLFGELERIASTGCIRYSRSDALVPISLKSPPVTGVLTGIVDDHAKAQCWGIIETLKSVPYLVPIDAKDMRRMIELQQSGSFLRVLHGTVSPVPTPPKVLARKLRATGKLADAIRSDRPIDLEYFQLPEVQLTRNQPVQIHDRSY